MSNIDRLLLYIDAVKHKFEHEEKLTKKEEVFIAVNFFNKSYKRHDGKG
jgi:hypothetical protein